MVIRGAGTKMDWGRPAARIDVMLDMRRLNRVLDARARRPDGDGRSGRDAARRQRCAVAPGSGAAARSAVRRRGHHRRHPRDQRQRPAAPPLRRAARSDPRRPAGDHRRRADEGRRPGRQERRRVRPVEAGRRLVRQPGGDRQRDVQALADSRGVEDDARGGGRTTPSLAQAVRTVMASQLEPMAFEVDVRSRRARRARRARTSLRAPRPLRSAFFCASHRCRLSWTRRSPAPPRR